MVYAGGSQSIFLMVYAGGSQSIFLMVYAGGSQSIFLIVYAGNEPKFLFATRKEVTNVFNSRFGKSYITVCKYPS